MKYKYRLLQQQYITDLLIKEEFRKFAIAQKISKHCIIDICDYCMASEIVGCFKNNEKWIVYETKRDGTKKGEVTFDNARDAFCAMAKKFNLDFHPRRFYTTTFKKEALSSNIKVATDLENTPSGDIALLNAVLIRRNIIQSSLNRHIIASLPKVPPEKDSLENENKGTKLKIIL